MENTGWNDNSILNIIFKDIDNIINRTVWKKLIIFLRTEKSIFLSQRIFKIVLINKSLNNKNLIL